MKRSERLALEGKIEVDVGTFEIAQVVTLDDLNKKHRDARYIGTDITALYNGADATADVYEDDDGNLYAVVTPSIFIEQGATV